MSRKNGSEEKLRRAIARATDWRDEVGPLAHLVHRDPDTRPRVLLVGEANPYGGDLGYALYPFPEGSAGARLQQLVLAVERHRYMTDFDRVNLCPWKWSAPVARATAKMICQASDAGHWDVVVLLGAKVAGAFRQLGFEADDLAAFTMYPQRRDDGTTWDFVCLPHPSGLSRAWNEPGAFLRARALVKRACPWLELG